MIARPSISQLSLILLGAVLAGGLLLLAVYAIHKFFRPTQEGPEGGTAGVRPRDDASFAVSTMQNVIASMKVQESEREELRRAAEHRARESARLSENVIREMPSGVLVFDRAGFITTANPAVRSILGVDTWSRRRYTEILGAESSLAAVIRECLETGKTTTRSTIEYTTPTGAVRTLGMSLSPFHSPEGAIEGAVCLLTDLTENRRLQEQVRLKDHLAALGAMSAGIAHEFKNSLATISGYSQLLRDGVRDDESRTYTEKIVAEIRSLTQVVTDFLALSKPLALEAREVNLQDLLRQAIEDLRRGGPFESVQFRLEGSYPPVEGDEVLLRQAFSNLLRNACEAVTDQGTAGWVGVEGACILQGGHEYLRVTISDSGPGIPESERDKIFLPFYTTKPAGTGLGLALVQKIVSSHNGLIALEPGSSDATKFSVLLPLRQDGQTDPATVAP